MTIIICKKCKRERLLYAKGLCDSCYVIVNYYSKNKAKCYANFRKHYKANEKKCKGYMKSYYQEHKSKLQKYGRDYWKLKQEKKNAEHT